MPAETSLFYGLLFVVDIPLLFERSLNVNVEGRRYVRPKFHLLLEELFENGRRA